MPIFDSINYAAENAPPPAGAPPVFNLDQVIYQLTTSWGGSDEGTTSTWLNTGVVYYSMPDTPPTLSAQEAHGFQVMSAVKKDAARLSFEMWDDLIAIDLTENTSTSANITFAYSSTTGNSTYADIQNAAGAGPDYGLASARIWMASQWSTHNDDSDMFFGGYGYITYIHEIGHALGLSHPGSYNGSASYNSDAEFYQDTRQYTVMSYFDADDNGSFVDHYGSDGQWKYASTPLLYDVAAIQDKYGADMTTRTGDTVYGFNFTADKAVFNFAVNFDPIICIWDAGGTDTLNCSGYSTNQHISLVAGTFSDVGFMTQNVSIAFNCTIEKAIGGSGDDAIYGNEVNNTLDGRAGFDQLFGGAGGDILIGGDGADLLNGGDGLDYASYINAISGVTVDISGNGFSLGDAAGDTFVSIERYRLSAFDDAFVGSAATDYAYGAEGNDTLSGGGGIDRLYGQDGADTLNGDAGNDILLGGAGADVFNGGADRDTASYEQSTVAVTMNLTTGVHSGDATGDVFNSIEIFWLSLYNDSFTGSAGDDEVRGYDGADTLNGAGGIDTLRGENGNDILNGDDGDDLLNGGAGADALHGGNGTDTAVYLLATAGVTINLTSGVNAGEALGDTYDSIEHFQLSNGFTLIDTFTGSAGADWVAGYKGVDNLNGMAGNDTLNGGEHNDVLNGGADNDKLIGGAGDDNLTGGTGSDQFWANAGAFGHDTVTDFENGVDHIRLTGIAGVTSFANLTISTNGSGWAVVTLPDGSNITLTGITAGQVDASDFLFA